MQRLLACGAAAGPLFVSVFLVEGARRPDYQPLRHPVSSLALGPRGWIQTANFTATGLLYLAGAAGLARSPAQATCGPIATAALGATGLCLLGSAAFPTDPVSGYPPGTPGTPAEPTRTGIMHNLSAVPIFLGVPAAAFACTWRFHRGGRPGWASYSAATGVAMLATTVLSGAGFGQHPRLVNHAGLFQRGAIVTGLSWLTALSIRARAPVSCPEGTRRRRSR
jgi:hypothetical protein